MKLLIYLNWWWIYSFLICPLFLRVSTSMCVLWYFLPAITAWHQFSCKAGEAGGVGQKADKSTIKCMQMRPQIITSAGVNFQVLVRACVWLDPASAVMSMSPLCEHSCNESWSSAAYTVWRRCVVALTACLTPSRTSRLTPSVPSDTRTQAHNTARGRTHSAFVCGRPFSLAFFSLKVLCPDSNHGVMYGMPRLEENPLLMSFDSLAICCLAPTHRDPLKKIQLMLPGPPPLHNV